MAHLNFLEQFEQVGSDLTFNPPQQDLPGYDAGYEAGLADAALQNTQLSAQLVDRLVEMRFGYAEAQQAMMAALAPFVSALADQVLPALSDDLTRVHLKEVLMTAAQADIANPIVLTFHPKTAALVGDVLQDIAEVQVELREDASLGAQEMYVGNRRTESQLDVAGLIASIQSALSNITTRQFGEVQNG